VAHAAAGADVIDDREDDVLGTASPRKLALDGDRHRAGAVLRQRLRREDVFDLAGADAERERAERTVRAGMGIATDDDEAGLRVPLLGSDHVHDPLTRRPHRVDRDAELRRVDAESVHLASADLVGDGPARGRDVVIHRRDGEVGPSHRAAVHPKTIEGLSARDFMNEVQVDVEDVGLTRRPVDDMAFPDLFGERLRRHGRRPPVSWIGFSTCPT
jgi:hypothetical protein